MTEPRALLLDVEGSTSSVSFVTDTLFPYARARLADWVAENPDHPALSELPGEPVATLTAWMDRDAKETVLKTVQGLIWREGYQNGTLRGHVYADTPRALARWKAQDRAVYIYSSGSAEAQRLLFAHSLAGDLTPYLAGHFDTMIGPKREASSYAAIASALDLLPDTMLFVSDTPAEVTAARAAGMAALLIAREHDAGDVVSFDEVLP